MFRGFLAGVLFFAVVGGCGGNQTSDPSTGGTGASGGAGSGGTGAAGATGATGGKAGTGGTGGGVCGSGASCAKEGDSCTPPGCCQCSYTCSAGHWQIAACPGCVAPMCPPVAPTDGALCDDCQSPIGQPCSYDQCPSSMQVATCDGTTWHVAPGKCPAKKPCGTEPGAPPCGPGELCVTPGGLGDTPYCATNPCPAGAPVSCACAGSLCTYGYCSSATPTAVYCDCPNC